MPPPRQNAGMDTMASVMEFLQSLQGLPAYGLLFGVLAASGFGLPINEDILLLVAAALTLRGVMEPVPLIAVAWCGLRSTRRHRMRPSLPRPRRETGISPSAYRRRSRPLTGEALKT